jgi:hypothetical protein
MAHFGGLSLVNDVVSHGIDEARLFVRPCQQQSAGIGGDVTTVESGSDFFAGNSRKVEAQGRNLGQTGASGECGVWLQHNSAECARFTLFMHYPG